MAGPIHTVTGYSEVLLSAIFIELAREDAKLFQLKQKIAAIPGRIVALEGEGARVESDLLDTEAIYEKMQREHRKLENALAEARQRRIKSEARQSVITSTDAYQALVREIQQLDARIDELESHILESMERLDDAGEQRDRTVARLNDELTRQMTLGDQLEKDLAAARSSVDEQSKRRNDAVEHIDAGTRRLYERVLKAKGDAAIALVTASSCGICNGTQPPQIIQELRADTGLKTCQYCGRILVWDPNN